MSDRLIFICYSQKDAKWKNLLELQLGVLEQEGSFKVWSETDIEAGEDWYDKILEALDKACVAILLVSANSLNKKFILRDEIVRLLQLRDEQGLRIIPIIATDCLWENLKWLSRMQVRPQDRRPLFEKKGPKRDTELKNIAAEVAKILEASGGPGAAAGVKSPRKRRSSQTIPKPSSKAADPDGIKLKKLQTAEEQAKAQYIKARREREEWTRKRASQAQPTSGLPSEYQESQSKPPEVVSQKTENKPQFVQVARSKDAK